MDNDIRAQSARASETALSVVSDWTPWAVALAPTLILISNMTEKGGIVGFILSMCMVASVMFLIMGERRTAKYQIQELAQATTEAKKTVIVLRQELEIAHAILEGNASPATRGRIPGRTRRNITKRCANTCQFCARPGTTEKDPDGEAWHIEHVIPVNKGGPTRADNLTLACSSCNLRKGTMPAYAFIQKLIREGVRKQ